MRKQSFLFVDQTTSELDYGTLPLSRCAAIFSSLLIFALSVAALASSLETLSLSLAARDLIPAARARFLAIAFTFFASSSEVIQFLNGGCL